MPPLRSATLSCGEVGDSVGTSGGAEVGPFLSALVFGADAAAEVCGSSCDAYGYAKCRCHPDTAFRLPAAHTCMWPPWRGVGRNALHLIPTAPWRRRE